jgi:hypothetical protein
MVNDNVGNFTSEVNNIHNQSVDKITDYENQYLPYVRQYDK